MKRQLLEEEKPKGTPKKKVKIDIKYIPSISKHSLKDLYGFSDIISAISDFINLYKHFDYCEQYLVKPATHNFLFHGPRSCGKTFLAEAIAGELGWNLICACGSTDIPNASSIQELFDSAISSSPSVLLLDNLHELSVLRSGSVEMERDMLYQLCSSFDDLVVKGHYKVFVIGTTTSLDSIHSNLRKAGKFDIEIFIGPPNTNTRYDILNDLAKNTDIYRDLDIQALAGATPGFTAVELLHTLPTEAARAQARRREKCLKEGNENMTDDEVLKIKLKKLLREKPESQVIGMDDFNEALKLIQPLSKIEGFPDVPKVTWDQVGGSLREVRRILEDDFIAPVKYPEIHSVLSDEEPSGGILLYGPPGCGKTLFAKALANEVNFNFLSVRGPEFLSMHVGESERAVRECFNRARFNQPCIIFFDEIDSICQERLSSSGGDNDGSARVVSQMLNELDGINERVGVFVVAATNRPDLIDKALLRPGRLGKKIYIGIPSAEDRVDILKTLTRETPPMKDVDLDILGKDLSLDGFTGADLGGLVKQAAMLAIKKKTEYVTMDIFYEAARQMSPSVSPATVAKFNAVP